MKSKNTIRYLPILLGGSSEIVYFAPPLIDYIYLKHFCSSSWQNKHIPLSVFHLQPFLTSVLNVLLL